MTISKYNQPEYEGFYTSPEILSVIESIAGDSVLDLQSTAYRLWSSPSAAEDLKIVTLAKQLTDEPLYWGGSRCGKSLAQLIAVTHNL
jgi:hypothetical protein